MPENQKKENNEKIRSGADADNPTGSDRHGFTQASEDEFERTLETVRSRMQDLRDQENVTMLESGSSVFSATEDLARKKRTENYQKNKATFERISLGFQKPQNSPHVVTATVKAEGDLGREHLEELREQQQEEVERQIREHMQQDLTEKQKLVVKIAGEKAVNILRAAAEEMAERVEAGGLMGEVIILTTFVLAIAKDVADAFLATMTVASIPIPVIDIMVPVSNKLISWAIGFVASSILTYFWIIVAGSWKGSLATNWIAKKILPRFIIVGLVEDVIAVVPIYVFINFWCYYDYRREQKKAAEELEETQTKIEDVQKEVKNNIKKIDSSAAIY